MSKLALLFGVFVLMVTMGCGGGGGGGGSTSDSLPANIKLTADLDRGYVLDGGRISLVVLAGTVTKDTVVTVSNPTGLPSDANFVPNTAVKFTDATLALPVNLRLRYASADIPSGGSASKLVMVELVGGVWVEVAGSTVDTDVKQVRADISKFGTYGIRVHTSG